MTIDAQNLTYTELNELVRKAGKKFEIKNALGQRFIAAGLGKATVDIYGVPGNALGAYMDGAEITVHGNAQDAVGDTMNSGKIIVHGLCGDTVGYAMRGGEIYIKGNTGYRSGVHMKQYMDKKPVLVIGGRTGSFLGEYLAGGLIIVLGLCEQERIIGNFCGTGMHGGKIILRKTSYEPAFPPQVHVEPADLTDAKPYIEKYCEYFGVDPTPILAREYIELTPNSSNPYKELYVAN